MEFWKNEKFIEIGPERFGEPAALHRAYKAEIGEDAPALADMESLKACARRFRIKRALSAC